MLIRLIRKIIELIKKAMKNPKLFALDVVITVLVVLFVIIACGAIGELYHYAFYFSNNERTFTYRLEDERYSGMVRMYHENVASGHGEDKDLQEYYGVAKYYEAAVDYKLYTEAGEVEKAQEEKINMDEAYEEMGDFKFVREKIHAKLGIQN